MILSFCDTIASVAYSESEKIRIYSVDISTPIIKILSFVSIISKIAFTCIFKAQADLY